MELGAPGAVCSGLPRVYVTRRRHHNGARCSGAAIEDDQARCSGRYTKKIDNGRRPVDRSTRRRGRGGVSAARRPTMGDRASRWYYKKIWSSVLRQEERQEKSTPETTGRVELQEWVHESHSTKRCNLKATL
jgi:hypothetical protein